MSDPDLTPLMGIPVIRPATAEPPVIEALPEPPPANAEAEPVVAPVPRVVATPAQDEVLTMAPVPRSSISCSS